MYVYIDVRAFGVCLDLCAADDDGDFGDDVDEDHLRRSDARMQLKPKRNNSRPRRCSAINFRVPIKSCAPVSRSYNRAAPVRPSSSADSVWLGLSRIRVRVPRKKNIMILYTYIYILYIYTTMRSDTNNTF